jgi:hypothetical protein
MTTKTPPAKPSLIRSNVTIPPVKSDEFDGIRETIVQLKKERQAQAQLNHHARLCRDECEQYASIAAHHSASAERFSQKAEQTARTMPDPLAIILISIGTSFVISLAINHLSNQNHVKTSSPNIETARPARSGG